MDVTTIIISPLQELFLLQAFPVAPKLEIISRIGLRKEPQSS